MGGVETNISTILSIIIAVSDENMKEDLKMLIEKLHEDPTYMEMLGTMSAEDVDEAYFAEMYIQMHSPFAEIELEE